MSSTTPRFTRFAAGLLALALLAPSTASAQLTAPEGTVGPDVTVYSLHNFGNGYGSSGGIRAYSVGTVSCNIGDAPLNWCDNSGGCNGTLSDEQHPVIAQNLYRLKDGRFEQIGASWLKHGFLSLNTPAGSDCVGPGNQQCTSPPFGGNQLGIGCTDAYDASLNGQRPLGRKSEVDATTGLFPFPFSSAPISTTIDQRLQVAIADIDPTLNVGAQYWAEGHYIASDDAAAGNALNNASYRRVSVAPTTYNLAGSGGTVREQPAIRAWATADPLVELVNADVLAQGGITERFHVGRKVTEPVTGTWHYEYVIHNMNSDRAAQRFVIDFPGGTAITNVGFRDVNSHSGEPYSTVDWGNTVDGTAGSVSWQTELHSANPNANALRWATMYSFWFDADAGPDQIEIHTLHLFKPGTPDHVDFWGTQVTAGLDVTVTGDGTVVSDPAGIDCPATACAHAFLVGTEVELTASAAAGSHFVGWSGACSGTGTCDLTMDDAASVTAAFDTMPFLDGFESNDTSQWSSTSN